MIVNNCCLRLGQVHSNLIEVSYLLAIPSQIFSCEISRTCSLWIFPISYHNFKNVEDSHNDSGYGIGFFFHNNRIWNIWVRFLYNILYLNFNRKVSQSIILNTFQEKEMKTVYALPGSYSSLKLSLGLTLLILYRYWLCITAHTCDKVYELPQSYCGDNLEGTFSSRFPIIIFLILFPLISIGPQICTVLR